MLYNTLYYIRGDGYYEQYKADKRLSDYGIDSSLVDTDSLGGRYTHGDVVRQQWVGKNQIGWNPRLEIEHAHGQHALGGSAYYFDSDHRGEVVWAQHINGPLDPRHTYYQYFGTKWQGSAFLQEIYRFTDRLSTQVTAQVRYQRYKFNQTRMGAFTGYQYDVDWLLFSPRVGFTYKLSERVSVFTNFAVSSRTPTDASIYDAGDPSVRPSLEVLSVSHDSTNYVFGDPTAKNEHVYDFELGGAYRGAG
jgi:iron complex outermembrane receptor protein